MDFIGCLGVPRTTGLTRRGCAVRRPAAVVTVADTHGSLDKIPLTLMSKEGSRGVCNSPLLSLQRGDMWRI